MLTTVKLIEAKYACYYYDRMLLARRQQLDDIGVRLLPDGEILEIRKPVDVDSGMIVVNRPYAPEGVLLLIIAVIIFILTVMACVIILISWKK